MCSVQGNLVGSIGSVGLLLSVLSLTFVTTPESSFGCRETSTWLVQPVI